MTKRIEHSLNQDKMRIVMPEQEPMARIFDYKEHAEGLQRDYDLLLAEYNDLKAQRTWVGLTNKERADCWETVPELAMKKVEAKLKEKNT
tara:strand:- start:339 stop:608 length:270 start_codon:yes stop_codon:yes gene_type:complete